MKKILFVAAATTLALSSCSDNEITTSIEKSKTPITINVYQQGQTRVTTTGIGDLEENGFQLLAMNGDKEWIKANVTNASGSWVIGNGNTTYYWPGNDATAITFYGLYTPGNETINNDGTVTFTPDGDSDIVAAYNNVSYGDSNEGSVNLQFKHINAQVAVTSVALYDPNDPNKTITDFSYELVNIEFSKVPSSCIYNFAEEVVTAAQGATDTSLETTLNNALILPATSFDVDITYTVKENRTGNTETLTKSTTITDLVAGNINNLSLKVPYERAEMIIVVDRVGNWVDPAAH